MTSLMEKTAIELSVDLSDTGSFQNIVTSVMREHVSDIMVAAYRRTINFITCLSSIIRSKAISHSHLCFCVLWQRQTFVTGIYKKTAMQFITIITWRTFLYQVLKQTVVVNAH